MSKLQRALGELSDVERDQAIVRIMNEVLLPEWQAALAARNDPTAGPRIRAVQRVQNVVTMTSQHFAQQRRRPAAGRLVAIERALVADILERCVGCCRAASVAPAPTHAGATVPPPSRAAHDSP